MEKLKNIEIIAMDLDDTLLRDDLTISDYTVSVLQALMKKGVLTLLASGRSPRSVHSYAQRIGSDKTESYILCNNGTQILTSDMKLEIISRCLGAALALEIYDYIESQKLSCHLYFDDTIYIVKRTRFSDRDVFDTDIIKVVLAQLRHQGKKLNHDIFVLFSSKELFERIVVSSNGNQQKTEFYINCKYNDKHKNRRKQCGNIIGN